MRLGLAVGGSLAFATGCLSRVIVAADDGTTGATQGASETAGTSDCADAVVDVAPAYLEATTRGRPNRVDASCASGEGEPDSTIRFVVPLAGHYTFVIDSSGPATLAMMEDSCEGLELSCVVVGTATSLQRSMAAGESVVLATEGIAGPVDYTLQILAEPIAQCPDVELGSAVPPFQHAGEIDVGFDRLQGSCAPAGGIEETIVWTAPAAGRYAFDVLESGFDSALYLLDGACAGQELACNDNVEYSQGAGIVADLAAGQTVTVAVDGASASSTSYELWIDRMADACRPLDFGSLLPLTLAGTNAGVNGSFSSCGGAFAPEIQYSWTAPHSGLFEIGLDADFDWVLAIRDECFSTASAERLCSNAVESMGAPVVSLQQQLEQGETIVIEVDGLGHAVGEFELTIEEAGCAEDLGASDLVVTDGWIGRNPSAHTGTCAPTAGPDHAYTWTAPYTGTYFFSTDGSSFDTVLYLLAGACDGPEISCNDDWNNASSYLELSVVEGQVLTIVVDGFSDATGHYQLTVGTV